MAAAMRDFTQPPPWLRDAAEHEVVVVEVDTLAAYTHQLPGEVQRRSYWIKVSSFQALQRAVAASSADPQVELGTAATPLSIFLMPRSSLADAERISILVTGTGDGHGSAASADGGGGSGNAN